jgi:hypothetical protein
MEVLRWWLPAFDPYACCGTETAYTLWLNKEGKKIFGNKLVVITIVGIACDGAADLRANGRSG